MSLIDDVVPYEEVAEAEPAPAPATAAAAAAAAAPVPAEAKAQSAISGYSGIHNSGFREMILRPELLRAIEGCGFEHPSEVQQLCIPQAMLGVDVLCQAKSGMGKTAVFVLAILHQLNLDAPGVQALVLCHTRELAFQICNEFGRFSVHMKKGDRPAVKTVALFGGIPVADNQRLLQEEKPNIVVGTPGRVKDLVQRRALDLSNVCHFVIDECDKVLDKLDMRGDVQEIFCHTPRRSEAKEKGRVKQVMMFTATLRKDLRPVCEKFMSSPQEVFVDDEAKLTLHGLHQHFLQLEEAAKNRKLTELLDALQFNQVVIFVRTVPRAQALTDLLIQNNFPAITIHRDLAQEERLKRYTEFKDFKHRILVATDLVGRGIDMDKINIVINYDMPESSDTYLHRVGRAGRFGTKGLAITFASSKADVDVLNDVQSRFSATITELPEQISVSSYMNQ